MKIPLAYPPTRVQQLQAQLHQRRITLLQTRRRRVFGVRTSGRENRARLRALEAADQRNELLDAGVIIGLEGGARLHDGVGYVDYGDFHCLDLFLEGVVDAVCWDRSGESGGGEGEEGGEVDELHDCGLMLSDIEFGSFCMDSGVLEV